MFKCEFNVFPLLKNRVRKTPFWPADLKRSQLILKEIIQNQEGPGRISHHSPIDTREPGPPRVCMETTHQDVLEKRYVYVISHEPLQ